MEKTLLTPDTTFPYRLFRFAHKRTLDAVSSSYFAVVSKDSNPVGLILTIDIAERWHHAREAATTFWQIFVREFNQSESRSTLTRFEESLKELNRAIVKTEEKVKQPISVAAAVLEDSQIHFSTIGTNRVLLVRDGKFTDVTSGADKSGSQFAAVTSGDIDSRDTVCLVSQNLYEFLAAEPDALWSAASAEDLSKEILSRAQNSEAALNCVLLQYSPDQSAQTTLYWEESEKRYPISLPKISLPAMPKLSMPRFSLPKFSPGKLKLPHINLSGMFSAASASLRRLSPRWRWSAVVIIALLIALPLIFSRDDQESEPIEVLVAEEFRAVSQSDSLSYLTELLNSGNLSQITDEQLTEITATALERGIEIIQPTGHISELPEAAISISLAEESLFILSESGQLWQLDPAGSLKQIDHLFKVGSPRSLAAFGPASLVATDSIGNLWHYKGDSNGPSAIALPAALAEGEKLIARYGSNLYIYSRSRNAIYRQVNFTGEITTANPYTGLAAIANAALTSWTINGDFVAATEQNQLVGWRLSEQSFPAVTLSTDGPVNIASEQEELIIVQTGPVLEGYSNGSLIWRKLYWSAQPIDDIDISQSSLYLTIDKKIYRLAL